MDSQIPHQLCRTDIERKVLNRIEMTAVTGDRLVWLTEGMVLAQQTLCLEEIKIESCLTCALPGKKMEERFERVR